jgi:flagellar biosynthesis/type III secretory pathway M-ring protein FliF/YscJ
MLQLFLYFPEDKSEYIPATITMAIFFIAAIITMRFIIRYSKKEEEKAKQFEQQLKNQQNDDSSQK